MRTHLVPKDKTHTETGQKETRRVISFTDCQNKGERGAGKVSAEGLWDIGFIES